jgi:hypothetical protein
VAGGTATEAAKPAALQPTQVADAKTAASSGATSDEIEPIPEAVTTPAPPAPDGAAATSPSPAKTDASKASSASAGANSNGAPAGKAETTQADASQSKPDQAKPDQAKPDPAKSDQVKATDTAPKPMVVAQATPNNTTAQQAPAATANAAATATTSSAAPASAPDTSASLEQSLPQADSLTSGQKVIHVWLGDKGSDSGAHTAFDGDDGLKTQFAPFLDDYALEVRQFAISDVNTLYRIYVGPIESLEKAQELCGKIKQRSSDQICRPVIN